jgi:HK97 family phage prohead protease
MHRARTRSGAALIRDPAFFHHRSTGMPGRRCSTAVPHRARDTCIMLAPVLTPSVASVFGPRTRIAPDGTVEGYASVFGAIDAARDMVVRGAFADTLATRGPRRVPMLFQHDPAEPVGIWLELREDAHGLYARGRLIPEVARARELIALLRAGAIDGLSIGFRAAQARVDPRTRVRSLFAVDLWEISIVTFPLLAGARVTAVKQGLAPPPASPARLRAEREWARTTGAAAAADAPARRRSRLLPGRHRPGRIRTWRV